MVTYKLEPDMPITDEEREMLESAKSMPVIYDEDSPQLSEDMESAFKAARDKKPFNYEKITLFVSKSIIDRAKKKDADYIALLGKILDKAADEYL